MAELAAIRLALAVANSPAFVRDAVNRPLPDGIATLLEVAVGDSAALESAGVATSRSHEVLRSAAGFYIEQILFHAASDSYRVLGCAATAAAPELRRNMALLIRWLHPDVAVAQRSTDRTVFAHRVTQAWETLKTADRRQAYDGSLVSYGAKRPAKPGRGKRSYRAALTPPSRPRGKRRPGFLRVRPAGLLERVVAFFRGRER